MNNCFLALGSNLNRPFYQLDRAIKALGHLPRTKVLRSAPFYRNPAFGRKAQPMFYNTVVHLLTGLTPEILLDYCQKIEQKQGRIRLIQWGARTLDIDILLYASRKIKTSKLVIPHPRMDNRDFVQIPLLQLLNISAP